MTENNLSDTAPSQLYRIMAQGAFGGILAIFFGITLSRSMVMESYGEFSAAAGMLFILGVVTPLGLGSVAVDVIRQAIKDNHYALLRGFEKSAPIVLIVASFVALTIALGLHSIVHEKTAISLVNFAAILIVLPLNTLIKLFKSILTGYGYAHLAGPMVGWIWTSVQLLFLGIAVFFFGDVIGVIEISIVMASSSVVILAIMYYLTLSKRPKAANSSSKSYDMYNWLKSGMSFILIPFGMILISHGAFFVLGWVHADAEAIARFSATIQLASPVIVIGIAASALFTVPLVDAIKASDPTKINKILHQWYKSMVPIVMGVLIILIIFGDSLLGLYGSEFSHAHWATIFVAVSNGIFILGYLLQSRILKYSGHTQTSVKISTFWGLTGIALMYGLGDLWGEAGVVMGFVAAQIGGAVTSSIKTRQLIMSESV